MTWMGRLGWLIVALAVVVVVWLAAAALVYSPEYVVRVLAWGDHGQFIYISPTHNTIIVRTHT